MCRLKSNYSFNKNQLTLDKNYKIFIIEEKKKKIFQAVEKKC